MAVHGTLSVVLAFVLTGLSTIIIGLRFYSRYFLVGSLNSSDWVMFLALIAAWGSVVVNWYMVHFMDYSRIHNRETFAEVATGSLLMFWIYRLSYILDLCLIKTSILLWLAALVTSKWLNISPCVFSEVTLLTLYLVVVYNYIASSNKRFYYIVRALLTIILLGSASMIFAAVFTCYPVGDAWSFDVFEAGLKGVHATQCYNPGPFWLANAGFNLATDIMIWTLPVIFFLNLQSMPLRRRLELLATFSVGLLAVVASVVRLRVMVLWLSSFIDQGENTSNLLIWSQVEQNTGIIAGSLPFLRPIFRKALTKARSREQPSPWPAVYLFGDESTSQNPVVFRPPIIPSPSPTFGESEKGFRPPKYPLPPVEPVRSGMLWGGPAIWDGTQVRQLLPT